MAMFTTNGVETVALKLFFVCHQVQMGVFIARYIQHQKSIDPFLYH